MSRRDIISKDPWLTREETAEYLRRPVATLARWAWQGTGPKYSKVGRGALYRLSDVDRWLDQQANSSAAR